MKRFHVSPIVVLLVLSFFEATCEKTHESSVSNLESEPVIEHYVNSGSGAIYVEMEDSFNPSTKVSVAGSTGAASWTSGDQIAYCVTNGSSTQYNTATVDVSNSNILPDLASGYYRANYAVYPAASAGTDYTTPTVVYPTSYDLSGKTVETYSPVPMVATNTGGSLAFYHVGGLLRLHLTYVDDSATKVTVQFNGMTDVTGTYTVSNAGTASASTSVSTGGGNLVTFTSVPVASNETYLNIPLPSGSYSSLTSITVKMYDTSDALLGTRQKSFSWSTVNRGHAKILDVEPVYSLSISPTTADMLVNETVQYRAYLTKDGIQSSSYLSSGVAWSSSKTATATVNSSGLVTGKAAGSGYTAAQSTITARYTPAGGSQISATAIAQVSHSLGIYVSPASASVAVGSTYQFAAYLIIDGVVQSDMIPNNTSYFGGQIIEWSSANSKIASIEGGYPRGLVRGVKAGNTTIRCTIRSIGTGSASLRVN